MQSKTGSLFKQAYTTTLALKRKGTNPLELW